MTKDNKGRDVPDYDNMTAEQAAELLSQDFDESAEKVAEGMASRARKETEKAQKMKVDYEGDINDIKEQEEARQKAIDAGSFGLAAGDIEKIGFKGLVYFIPDEKLPLTSDTFDIFNKRTEKNEGNKDMAVKLAKIEGVNPQEALKKRAVEGTT